MLGRIIVGFIMVAAGFLITWKTDRVYRAVGRLPFGEKVFGSGGTRFLLKLIGLIIIFVGFLVITNLHVRVLQSIFGRLF
jgi:uncharacterized membrane protein